VVQASRVCDSVRSGECRTKQSMYVSAFVLSGGRRLCREEAKEVLTCSGIEELGSYGRFDGSCPPIEVNFVWI